MNYEGREPIIYRGVPGQGLIVVLHGGAGDPDQAARSMRVHFNRLETVVYAPGTGLFGFLHWNAGMAENMEPCFNGSTASDVGYIRGLIQWARDRYATGDKVLLLGHSQGAAMAASVAAQAPELTGVAMVCGGPVQIPVEPYRGAPALLRYGASDDTWPYATANAATVAVWAYNRFFFWWPVQAEVPSAARAGRYFKVTPFIRGGGHAWSLDDRDAVLRWWDSLRR